MHNKECGKRHPRVRDFGPEPLVLNIEHATKMNENFRLTLWTGHQMQLTLMSIPAGGEIGVEMHDDVDQFIRIESGHALVRMGQSKCALCEEVCVDASDAIIIPAGTWHNLINAGRTPLKLYSLYAPPKHPFGTVHRTHADAMCDEE